MAVIGRLYITEYSQIGAAAMDAIQAPQAPPVAEQAIEIHDNEVTQSEPFDGGTRFIVVWADCPCWLGWKPKENPQARVGFHPLPAERVYGVSPRMRLAVHGGKL
jgi:hypothetical protein